MRDELLPMMVTMGYRIPAIELHHMGSEDFPPEPESLDCCLSSPPYSSHEKYSDEPTKSYIRFPTNELWMNEDMRMALENCRASLRRDGFLVMNLADTKSYSPGGVCSNPGLREIPFTLSGAFCHAGD